VHQPEQTQKRGPGVAAVGHPPLVLEAFLAQAIGQGADAVVASQPWPVGFQGSSNGRPHWNPDHPWLCAIG
jgi:hypothetical protein